MARPLTQDCTWPELDIRFKGLPGSLWGKGLPGRSAKLPIVTMGRGVDPADRDLRRNVLKEPPEGFPRNSFGARVVDAERRPL